MTGLYSNSIHYVLFSFLASFSSRGTSYANKKTWMNTSADRMTNNFFLSSFSVINYGCIHFFALIVLCHLHGSNNFASRALLDLYLAVGLQTSSELPASWILGCGHTLKIFSLLPLFSRILFGKTDGSWIRTSKA